MYIYYTWRAASSGFELPENYVDNDNDRSNQQNRAMLRNEEEERKRKRERIRSKNFQLWKFNQTKYTNKR